MGLHLLKKLAVWTILNPRQTPWWMKSSTRLSKNCVVRPLNPEIPQVMWTLLRQSMIMALILLATGEIFVDVNEVNFAVNIETILHLNRPRETIGHASVVVAKV